MDLFSQARLKLKLTRPGGAPVLTSARLRLRPVHEGDLPHILPGLGNYDVARWLGEVSYPYTEEAARQFIAQAASAPGRVWTIEHEGAAIGGIALQPELGYWIARHAWGQGFATEAVEAVIDAHFSRPAAGTLHAALYQSNARSAAVLRKAGFRADGGGLVAAAPLGQQVPAQRLTLERGTWRALRRYRLETPRLRLRELRPGDWRAVQRIGSDPRVAPMTMSTAMPWLRADVERWIALSRYRGRPGFRAAIVLPGGRLGGVAGLGGAPLSCAFFIDPALWGRGYATEALSAFLADCARRFGIDRVEADHYADNPASGAVLRKLGFRQIGTGTGHSPARLEPAPILLYRLSPMSQRGST
ncbi:GNAT family N-acetyltransferase [Profundibacterium mesophilum]|uniref:Acetyltransferase n=1 Tax=Profundibacterium mesophilum KAUST100406-0324 TaxID=1037889 RepID=A0A921TE90_9RHOB|nr:GNAT family N-acetyltransferase [Profundibacterium mesophilum]KAF0675179.1 Acetyltransferase [Profundibacterium mesophilum KAUST100406-0324]